MSERRECPYCAAVHPKPANAVYDPYEWMDHLFFNHHIGERQPYFTFPENLTWEQLTWEQAEAWYHSQLLGVEICQPQNASE